MDVQVGGEEQYFIRLHFQEGESFKFARLRHIRVCGCEPEKNDFAPEPRPQEHHL